MSKVTKTTKKVNKKTCTFIMKRGDNKGNKCGRPCKTGDRCKFHTKARIEHVNEYNANKNRETKKKNLNKRIERIKESGKFPNISKESQKLFIMKNERVILTKKKFACRRRLNPDIRRPYVIKYNGINVPDTMKIIEQELKDECDPEDVEGYEYHYELFIDDKLKKHFDCTSITLDDIYMYIKPFDGTPEEAAKNIKVYDKKLKILIEKINAKIALINEISKLTKTITKEANKINRKAIEIERPQGATIKKTINTEPQDIEVSLPEDISE